VILSEVIIEKQNKKFDIKRLTTLCESSEAENGEPQLQNKRGKIKNYFLNRENFKHEKKTFSIFLSFSNVLTTDGCACNGGAN